MNAPQELIEQMACHIINGLGWTREDCIVLPGDGCWEIYGHGRQYVRFYLDGPIEVL